MANGTFARSVALIASGAALAQGLTFLSAPILSRLFTPEAFGLLGLFTAAAWLLGTSANLRYELPIVIARQDRVAATLVHVCVSISAGLTLASGLLVTIWGDDIAALFDAPQLAPYLLWIPVHILATGIFLAMSQWACRRREFALLAKNPVTRTGTTTAVQLGAGALVLGQGWLIIGFIAGQIAAAIGVTVRLLRRDWEALRPRAGQLRRMIAAARRFRRFPQFSAPQELINAASQQMPTFILGLFFGPATVGLYWLTVRVLQAPSALIGQAVRQVFYQRACETVNQSRSAFPLMAKATSGLLIIGAFCFLPIVLFGPSLFTLVFGEPWQVAGDYARWVALWVWIGFANVPAFCGLQALGAQRELLVYEVLLFIGRNGALLFVAATGGQLEAIAAYALAGMAFNAGLIGYGLIRAWKESDHYHH